jgi:prophage maintenance system killer protein
MTDEPILPPIAATTASDAEVVVAFLALASGELSEEKTADWSRQRTERAAG